MRRILVIAVVIGCALGMVAQERSTPPQPAAPSQSSHAGRPQQQTPEVVPATPQDTKRANDLERRRTEPGASIAEEEARTANQAAGQGEGSEGGENAAFRESPSVRWLSSHTGIPLKSAYWVFIALNFAILAFIIYVLSKSRLPEMFRSRTQVIRKSLDEAQHSSADANRRLTDIENRLARLDTDVAEIRAQADREAAAEEHRIQAAAAEDQQRIVNAAQAEIEAIGKNARRELKVYAADLAVALAQKRIQVDAATDQQLVRSFTDQLGSNGDGKGRS